MSAKRDKKNNLHHTVQWYCYFQTISFMPSRQRLLILIWTFDNDWTTLKHKRIWTLCLTPLSPHQITAKTIAKLWETWHEWEESCCCFLPHPSIQPRSFSNATARLAKWISRTKGRKRRFPTSRTQSSDPLSQALWSDTNRSPSLLVPASNELRG